jgi:hypothetical protein
MKEVLPVDTGMDITTERRPNSGSNDEAENLQFRERTKDAKNINGAYLSILLAAGVPFIIVVSICGVLLGLTFSNRVILEPGWPELQLPVSSDNSSTSLLTQAESFKENGGSGAYYIQFNPSSLTTIASWTGKVIPYLSSATMALAAFFAANHIREKSRTGRDEELLTPHQLSLLLGLLSGGAEQLWETVRYRCRRGKHLPKPIPLVFTALSVTILLG